MVSFQISLHTKDKAILDLIQYKLGIGKIYTAGPTAVTLEIRSIKELLVLKAHASPRKISLNKPEAVRL